MNKQMSLFEFDPNVIELKDKEQTEDEKIKEHIRKKPASEILKNLRENGHPVSEFDEVSTWRSYYLSVCSEKGKSLLEELGWPTDLSSKYVNIHVGCVETMDEAMNSLSRDCGHEIKNEYDKVWSLIECWEPYDESKINQYSIDYLKKNIKSAELQLENAKKGISTHGLSTASEKKEALRHIEEYTKELKKEIERVPQTPPKEVLLIVPKP